MEPEVGVDQPRLNMSLARGCRLFGRILYMLILFFLLACIMILLTVLNRSGWFALLSGVFGALLYCTLTLPRVVFRMRQASLAQRQARDGTAGMHARRTTRPPTRRPTVRGTLGGLLLFSLLGTAAFVGLYFLPGQGPVFALISGVLGLSFFFSLFQVSMSVLGLVLIQRGRARNASLEGHGAPPSDGGEHEAGERTP
jgi:hypothetical protein